MKLIDAALSTAIVAACVPVFAWQYAQTLSTYEDAQTRLKKLSDARETIALYEACRAQGLPYPKIEGYDVSISPGDGDTVKAILHFSWSGDGHEYALGP